jgi:UDP-N-acetylmuramoyl-L-alanyl-D-glutamate--2,6-diaminopimelate ligase
MALWRRWPHCIAGCSSHGLGEAAKIRATQLELESRETNMLVETPGYQFSLRLPLIGRHNIYNALAATGAGLALAVGEPVIREALQTLPAIPGRLEIVPTTRPFSVYVDYAHTDDALHHVLRTLREITRGRVLLAFGCGGSRDTGKRSQMGKVAAELSDFTIITSDNPRKESPSSIAAQIEEGFRSVRQANYRVELDRRRAIGRSFGWPARAIRCSLPGRGMRVTRNLKTRSSLRRSRACAEALELLDLALLDDR